MNPMQGINNIISFIFFIVFKLMFMFCTNTIMFIFYSVIFFFTFGNSMSSIHPLVAIAVTLGLVIALTRHNVYERLELWIVYSFYPRIVFLAAQAVAGIFAGRMIGGAVAPALENASSSATYQILFALIISTANLYSFFKRLGIPVQQFMERNSVIYPLSIP